VAGKIRANNAAQPIKQKTTVRMTVLEGFMNERKNGLGECAKISIFLTNTATFVKHKRF
jgi:hypothetical protein